MSGWVWILCRLGFRGVLQFYDGQIKDDVRYIYVIKAGSVTQASLAQLVERGTSNAEVTGSTPLGGSAFCSFYCTMSNLLCSFCSIYTWQSVVVVVVKQNERERR
jgi:hypothetical protein